MALIVLRRSSIISHTHLPVPVPSIYQLHEYSTSVKNTSDDSNRLASLKRGTGGRSSFSGIVATVFGATGFIGRYVCNRLAKIGSQLIIPYRADAYEALRLKVCGDLGQVLFQPYHLEDEASIAKAVKYSNVVVNLVGRDWETRNFSFGKVHVDGARRLARICKEQGVTTFIHFSALNAVEKPKPFVIKTGSRFLSSKALGEKAVLEEFPDAVIIRPADVYGQEDRFLRYYSHPWRHQGKWMPVWHKGEKIEKQPVYVGDVAAGVSVLAQEFARQRIIQAVGPKRYTLAELLDWFHRLTRREEFRRYDLRFDPTFSIKVQLTQLVQVSHPIANLHWERIERECHSDTVLSQVETLEDLGIQLTTMENQVPWELRPFISRLYYDADLNEFEKPTPPKTVDF